MEQNKKTTNSKKVSTKSKLKDSVFFVFNILNQQASHQSRVLSTHSKFDTLHPSSGGFTIVETLVAIAILVVAIVGPMSIIGSSVHSIYYARDEMVAINLAQEGIEAVQQIKDSNKLAGNSWVTGLATGNYTVDMVQLSLGQLPLISCPSCSIQPVLFDTGTGLYRQGAGSTPTQFKRLVVITNPYSLAYQRMVTSTVTWQTGGQTGTVAVSENMFDWQI